MSTTFIYILIDPVQNTIRYVGKTNNPDERFKNHKNKSRDKNTHKRNWINKLRSIGFKPEMEIIDEVSVSEWKYWEKFWIGYFKCLGFDLVNYTEGGDGLTFGNQTSFKKGDKSKKVVGYDKNGNLTFEFNSAEEATCFFKHHRSVIPACCLGKIKTSKNTAWFYLDDIVNLKESELGNKILERFTKEEFKSNSGNFCKGVKSKRARKVEVTDTLSSEIKVFESGTDASIFLKVSQAAVSWSIRNKKSLAKKRYIIKFYDK